MQPLLEPKLPRSVGAALIATGQLKGELATLGFGSATFIQAELE